MLAGGSSKSKRSVRIGLARHSGGRAERGNPESRGCWSKIPGSRFACPGMTESDYSASAAMWALTILSGSFTGSPRLILSTTSIPDTTSPITVYLPFSDEPSANMQYPTIYEGLTLACRQGKLPGIDLTDITYYIGRETIIPREDIPGMWVWREALFAFLQRNAERTAAFFDVPAKQVVEFGTEIEI